MGFGVGQVARIGIGSVIRKLTARSEMDAAVRASRAAEPAANPTRVLTPAQHEIMAALEELTRSRTQRDQARAALSTLQEAETALRTTKPTNVWEDLGFEKYFEARLQSILDARAYQEEVLAGALRSIEACEMTIDILLPGY